MKNKSGMPNFPLSVRRYRMKTRRVDREVKFVEMDRNRGFIHENNELVIDDSAESKQNTR